MKIWILAYNTFLEIIRDRVLYGLFIFAVLLIGLSLALGELSFTEQSRIALNFGMVGMQLSAVMLAVFVGSSLVSKEIEKQTILTILSRPVSRASFIIGKFLGLSLVISVVIAGLVLILLFVTSFLEAQLGWAFVVAILGVFLEAMVLLSLTLLFGVMIRPLLTVSCTLAIFLIGHWVGSLEYFVTRSESAAFKFFGTLIARGLPNLERFNWRSLVVYQDPIPVHDVQMSILYAITWMVLLISMTIFIFRRKDFV